MRLTALLTGLLLALAACGGDDPAEPAADAPAATAESTAPTDEGGGDDDADDVAGDPEPADEGTDEDGGDVGDDPLADGEAGVVLDLAGQRVTAGPDATVWGCATTADASVVSFQFLDDAGNDVSVTHEADGATTASLTLADGTAWNAVEGGTAEVDQEADGVLAFTIEVASGDSGESALLEGRLRCV